MEAIKTIVIEATQCPGCGKPPPPGVLAGLCPACLLAQGAETETGGPTTGRFEPPPVEEVGRLFPQLEVLGLLGAGGMGAVYRARQPALDRIVALKILPANGPGGAAFEERFNREARALARLSHPNIVAVFEFGRVAGLHFFIMEFVDGANLRQLEQAGRLSPREALQLIPQICDALQYAHDEGVVHRDIKPENVLVDRKGRVKIADFGLAKILGTDPASARLTAEGQVMGTPHYMAPEQVERPLAVDHRADIYSLGVVLYEMLTGDLPLGRFDPPSRKVEVDVRFDEVVLRALENDPARRYQQASEVKTRVTHIADSPPPAAAATAEPAVPCFHWAGFRLVEELQGRRTIHRRELLKAWAILFFFLTLALAPVSLILGHSYLGFIGLSGFPSLIFRAGAAAVIIGLVVSWALIRPEGAAMNPPDDAWWRRVWKRAFIVTFWIAAWVVFQFNWLHPWLKEQHLRASRVQAAVGDGTSDTKTPGTPQPADPANQAAAVEAIRAYGGFVKTNLAGQVIRISLVYDEDDAGNRRECTRTDDEFVQWLPAFPELQELWLWKAQANDRTLQVVGELRHLKDLYLWDAAVTDAGIIHLQHLAELRRLHINNAGLGDAALATLGKLPRLEHLSLQGNNFTDEGLVQLQGMTSLRELYISDGTDRFTAAGTEPLVRRGILLD